MYFVVEIHHGAWVTWWRFLTSRYKFITNTIHYDYITIHSTLVRVYTYDY